MLRLSGGGCVENVKDQLMGLAVAVNVALATGPDGSFGEAELVAENKAATGTDGGDGWLSVAEVVEWCASSITVKDVAQLRRR